MFWSRKPKILAKGSLAERPWAATLAALSSSATSGELTLQGDGKEYRIAFANGQLVGAASPLPSDTLQRIALANRVAPPANIAAAMRIVGRNDDIAKFADAADLVGDDAVRFKRRVIVQRAARTFAVERGSYVVTDRVTISVVAGVEIDVRAALYRGMRLNLSELKLTTDLRTLGARFILYPEAAEHLARFDFDREAEPILADLRGGISAAELEARHRGLDPRLIFAVLGSLATCRVITPIDDRSPATQDVSIARTPTHREPTVSRVPTPRQPTTSTSQPVALRQGPPPIPRHAKGSRPPLDAPARAAGLSRAQIEQLLASRVAMLEAGVDLFTFLGLPFGAPVAHVQAGYQELVRYLRPDRLAQLGICDRQHQARVVFAQAVAAMTVLTDEVRRAEYLASIGQPRCN